MKRVAFDPLEAPEHPDPGYQGPGWFAAGLGCAGTLVLFALGGAAFLAAMTRLDSHPGRVLWGGPLIAIAGTSPQGVVENNGAEHCGWESVRVLAVPAPVIPGFSGNRFAAVFVRDRNDSLMHQASHVVGTLDLNARLPADAVRTGYNEGTRELWFSPSDTGAYAYIVDPKHIERWPRFDGGCD